MADTDPASPTAVPTKRKISVLIDRRENVDFEDWIDKLTNIYNMDVHDVSALNDGLDPEFISQLKLGDILFMDHATREVLEIVERKGVRDLEASIRAGHMQPKRLYDQLSRMKGSRVPHLTLLLTGDYSRAEEDLRKTAMTLNVRLPKGDPQINVVRVDRVTEVPHFIARTAQALETYGQKQSDRPGVEFTELMVATRKNMTDTPEKLYHCMLQLIPGFSQNSAMAVVRDYPRLATLRRAVRTSGVSAITKIKSNNRALNKTSAGILVALIASMDEDHEESVAA
jgi:ERCC4-type nuclease